MDLLQKEILDKPAEAALPCNLSDFWLGELAIALEVAIESSPDAENSQLAAPLALIGHILTTKNGGKEMSVTWEELFKHFNDYRIEIALEEVSRRTDIKSNPATLETIFSDRDVEISKK